MDTPNPEPRLCRLIVSATVTFDTFTPPRWMSTCGYLFVARRSENGRLKLAKNLFFKVNFYFLAIKTSVLWRNIWKTRNFRTCLKFFIFTTLKIYYAIGRQWQRATMRYRECINRVGRSYQLTSILKLTMRNGSTTSLLRLTLGDGLDKRELHNKIAICKKCGMFIVEKFCISAQELNCWFFPIA